MTGSASSSGSPRPRRFTLLACVGLLCVIWGSTWVVIREGLDDMPPMTSAWIRFAFAAACMTLIAPAVARREGGGRPGWRLSLVMGLCNFSTSYGLVYYAETILPSGLVSLLWSVFPMTVAIAAHVSLPGERLQPLQWFGFVGGFVGVVLLLDTDVAALGEGATQTALLLLLSPAVSALGTTYVKKHGSDVSSALLNRNGMIIGAVTLALAAFLLEPGTALDFPVTAWVTILYLAVVGTVVTFGLYFWALRHAPAYQLSLIAYITPAIALALGATLRDEPVGLTTLAGGSAILLGVAFVLFGKKASATKEA